MLLENQADVLCNFHDGSFTKFTRTQKDVDFLINIPYLAEIVNPEFSLFNGKLKHCSKLDYITWENEIIKDLNALETLELEIISAEVRNNEVIIKCYANSGKSGGELTFIADEIIVYDENGQEIIPDMLNIISKQYWDKL